MKASTLYIAMTVAILSIAGCNNDEKVADTPAKSEQPAKESRNIMRMDKPGPAPEPSKYKGKF